MKHAEISQYGTNETITFAVAELAEKLAALSGVHIDTCGHETATVDTENLSANCKNLDAVHVGVFDATPTDIEVVKYRLEVRNDRLSGYITGDSPRSMLLAVYRSLRDLGWRWPDPYIERVPTVDDVESACPVNVEYSPSYRHRGICIEGAVSEDHVKAMINWAPKAGFNGYFIQFREGHTFFDRYSFPKTGKHLSRNDAAQIIKRIAPEIVKRGLDYHAVGHGWTCEPFGIPGLGWVEHESKIPESISRSFAKIDGVRELYDGIALNTNLCYSSEVVQKTMAGAVTEYAAEHEEVTYLHIWLADGSNNNCECPSCSKMRPSDFYVQILNRIDSQLAEKNLPTKIVFLAYVDLLWPPEHERLANPDRFVLMFAPISRSYSTSFQAEKPLPDIAPFVRNKLEFPKSVEVNLAHLKAWQKQFTGDGFDFDYHMMWDHYTDPGYTHIARVLHDDIVSLANIGLAGYMSCQVQRAFFPTGLCMHVMGETLWNRDRSYQAISDDFFETAFPGRGSEICIYLTKVSSLFSPEYLRSELEEDAETTAARFLEAKAFLESSASIFDEVDGSECELLKNHNTLLITLADALALRAGGKQAEAFARWCDAKRFIEQLDPAILDRLDDYMFKRVVGGRLFDDKSVG